MDKKHSESKLMRRFFHLAGTREIMKQGGNFSPLAASSIGWGIFPPYIHKYYNFDFGYLVLVSQKKHGFILLDSQTYLECNRVSWQRYAGLSPKEKLQENFDFLKIHQTVRGLYRKYTSEKYKKLSSNELHRHFKILLDNIAKLLAATIFSESLDEALVREFYEKIAGNKEKFHHFFFVAAKPDFISFVSRFDEELLRMHRSGNIESLQWVFCDYYAAPQIKEVESLFQNTWKKKGGEKYIKSEIQKIKKEISREKEIASAFKKTLSLKERRLFDFIQLALYTRDYRKESLQKLYTLICNVARELFSRFAISPEIVAFATTTEILEKKYMKKGYRNILTKRENGELTFIDQGGAQVDIVDFESVRKKIFSLVDKSDLSEKEIHGNIAYKGKVIGCAFVIQHEGEFSKFQDGGILVTSMTRPEYIPLIKRAKAIITDEGGITCHAAIISRELKIPCIVGTKNATRILRDGDLVEVDAERGIVKILKKADAK
jgi:phosphohistidine swiveling domain-containing protein